MFSPEDDQTSVDFRRTNSLDQQIFEMEVCFLSYLVCSCCMLLAYIMKEDAFAYRDHTLY